MISDKTRMGPIVESDSESLGLGESEESFVLEGSEEEEREKEEVEDVTAAPKTVQVQMRRVWVGKCNLNLDQNNRAAG